MYVSVAKKYTNKLNSFIYIQINYIILEYFKELWNELGSLKLTFCHYLAVR